MKNRKNKFQFLVPGKLNEKLGLYGQNPPKIKSFNISYLEEIIYLICVKVRDNGYSQLKMSFLKNFVPHAEKYIKFLLEENIIVRDGFYHPGSKSYGYKFSPKYESIYQPYSITDTKLKLRIERTYKQIKFKGIAIQNKWIKDLNIDQEAMDFAKAKYTDLSSINYAIASIIQIQNNEKFYKIDRTSHRFHSNITVMPKELRCFLTIKNKHLIGNIDIKNSQPYFSTILLTSPNHVAKFAKGADLRLMLTHFQVKPNEDIDLYIDLVCKGMFYEYLIKEFAKRGVDYTRDQVKKEVMKILFDNNNHVSKSRKIFSELFPNVDKVFYRLRGNQKGNHFENYKRFAILLQTIESNVVLNIILKRLYKEHSDIIVLTIHDSFLCDSNLEIVKEVMLEELKNYVGFSPILKTELLCKGNATLETAPTLENRRKEGRRKEPARLV